MRPSGFPVVGGVSQDSNTQYHYLLSINQFVVSSATVTTLVDHHTSYYICLILNIHASLPILGLKRQGCTTESTRFGRECPSSTITQSLGEHSGSSGATSWLPQGSTESTGWQRRYCTSAWMAKREYWLSRITPTLPP